MDNNVFKFGYMKTWRQTRRNVKNFFRTIKWAYQRATKGYCDIDLWNLDQFYSKTFINTLKEFADSNRLHGAPDAFFDHDNDSVQPWVDYLNEMRQHFENAIKDYHDEIDKHLVDSGGFARTMSEHLSDYNTFYTYTQEELEKAFRMMAKVYFDLWD